MLAGRHEPENLKPMADALWNSLLVFAAVSVGAFLCYGLWIFWGTIENLNSPYVTSQPTPTPGLSRLKLQEVLQGYDARSAQFESTRTGGVTVSDPSR